MYLILLTLVMTHITILCVTIFLHRTQAHRSLTLNPVLSHFMRFWLWLTTGMVTKEWVAIHRKHHRSTDQEGDPHSPIVFGIWKVLFGGAFLYASASKDKIMIDSYGKGTPDDWIEKNLYTKHSKIGFISLLIIETYLFHGWGIIMWLVQMMWIPFWAAGVVNGVGHWFGYRNTETKDNSKNIIPIGFIIGGEELHNNHHNNPASAKLSEKWFEFDIGWFWIKLLSYVKIIKIKE
jgi:stearoyl-CoA desaturase (delta-9 desaturase)